MYIWYFSAVPSSQTSDAPKLEDTLADYQPPKRAAKKQEKDDAVGPSVFITVSMIMIIGTHKSTELSSLICVWLWIVSFIPDTLLFQNYWGGPERMGPRPPTWVPLLKGSSILSTSLGSKTLNTSFGLGGNQNWRPSCRRHLAGIFHTPTRCLQEWHTCPHSQCFGFYFDVIFLMYLAFLSSQPHPHQSSSSTQFSQEWVGRKVVVKHSINPNLPTLSHGLCYYSKTCLQGTLRREDTLLSGDTFSKWCPIFPMLRNLWRRDTCHVGTLSLGYRGVPWRQVLLYIEGFPYVYIVVYITIKMAHCSY